MKPLYLLLLAANLMAACYASGQDTTSHPTDSVATFTKVEIEAEYPGGQAAWLRYLNKTLRYPDKAVDKNIMGTVIVQFTVDTDGKVSDIQAVSGPTDGGLREEAVRLIRVSRLWMPAVQNGKQVRSIRRVPIVFKLVNGN
jgi:protein TonB